MNDGIAESGTSRKSKADRNAKVHEDAMRLFDAIWAVEAPQREQNIRDRRLARIRGAWWEGQLAFGEAVDEYGNPVDTGAPRLEIPKFLRASRRIKGEYRSSRKMVDFKPKGEDSDKASANNLDGLYRADLNDSPGGFGAAQDNAFDEGIDGGIGGWRLRARYDDETDEKNEQQRIEFVPVHDADMSMFFDLGARRQDKSDARHGFLLFRMSREAFEAEYPEASASTFDKAALPWSYDWTRQDDITLAEYFRVDERSILRRTFRQTALDAAELPEGIEADEQTHDDADLRANDGKLESDLHDKGYVQVRSRRIKRPRVVKYVLSGTECLEGPETLPGRYVPLIPYYAERTVIEGIERTQGIIRPGIDAGRLYNLMASNLAETAAAPADETPIVSPDQVDGPILLSWARRKVDRPAVLVLKDVYAEDGSILRSGLAGVVNVPQVAPATAALIQMAGTDIPDIMGLNEQPATVPANTSAAAIQLVNDRGDVADFVWRDNFEQALAHDGRVWLSMAQDLYVEEGRKMTTVSPEGKQSTITLAERQADDEGSRIANDLTTGRYDVIVDVGPATKTRRDATVKNCLAIGQVAQGSADPSMAPIAAAMLGTAILNMEGEGIEGPQALVRKVGLQQGWVEPTEEEAAQLAAQQAAQGEQQDPNLIAANAQMLLAQAEEMKARTGLIAEETRRITAEANAEKARAETAAALAGIDRKDREQVLDEVKQAVEQGRADERDDHGQRMDVIDRTMSAERHDADMTGGAYGNAV
jgi:hypothetical protein